MLRFLPIQAKLAILMGVVALLGISYWIIRQHGYNACTAKYERIIATHKTQSRKEILEIEGTYNDTIKKMYSIPTENNICGPRTIYAIDSLHNAGNSK